jgi:hypothetical protein
MSAQKFALRMFTAVFFIITKRQKVSTDKWLNKIWHTHPVQSFDHKGGGALVHATAWTSPLC